MACIREESCGGTAACDGCPGYESADEQENAREVKDTCDGCGKNLYDGDTYWGNNQIGTYCEDCAEKEIAEWWGII